MPDWCFVDDANPDWDAACEQRNNSKYTQFDIELSVAAQRRLGADLDHGHLRVRERRNQRLHRARHDSGADERRVGRRVPGAAAQRCARRRAASSSSPACRTSKRTRSSFGFGQERRGTSTFTSAGGERERCRRRPEPERHVQDRRREVHAGFAVLRGIHESDMEHHRPPGADARRALGVGREEASPTRRTYRITSRRPRARRRRRSARRRTGMTSTGG